MKNRSTKTYLCAAIAAAMTSGVANADTLATWSFDGSGGPGDSAAQRLAVENATAEIIVSDLDFNDLSTDTSSDRGFFNAQDGGGSVLPWAPANGVATNYDGIGFGGNSGEQVMFLHRATFFDGSAVPPKPKASDYTSFGEGGSQGTTAGDGDGHAPISFTVENTGTEDVNIIGLKSHMLGPDAFIFGIQEAGAAPGPTTTLGSGGTGTAMLAGSGVVVGAGQTKTFTVSVNSGKLDSKHSVNYFELISGAPPVVATLEIAQPMPVVNDADIAVTEQDGAFGSSGADALWGNQMAQGTTFTTGDHPAGYTLRSFSLQIKGPSFREEDHAWTFLARVGKVEGTVMTEVIRDYEEAGAYGQWGTNDNWMTLTFSTPIHLEPETVYGADFGCDGWGGQPLRHPNNDLYTGGQSYRSGTANSAPGTGDENLQFTGHERIFHLDMTADPLPDPTLVRDSGTYAFGRLYHPAGTDSTSQTVTYRNGGETETLTIESVTLTDDASGIFSLTAAPANGTVIPPGGTFDVEITATGGSGYTDYIGALLIDTSHGGEAGDQDLIATPNAEIVANGDTFIIVDNPKLDNYLEDWSGDAWATEGLVSLNGARVRGAGDPDTDLATNNLAQAFNYWLSPDFDLSLYFALPDWSELGATANGANYDRAFQLAVQATPLTPGGGDFDNGDTMDTLINLFYFPAGAGGSAAEGFYLYDGVSDNFTHLAGLGTVTASTGISTNSPLPSNLVVYQLTINGRGFGTPAAAYDISISDPNATTIAATVSGLTTYHGVNPADATAKAVVLTTSDKAGSDTNPLGALQASFWVDDIEVALLETVPLALFHQATPPGAPKTLVGGTRELSFSVANAGFASDLTITSNTFATSEFSLVSPALPVSIAPGASQEFVVSGHSIQPGLTSDAIEFATSDPVVPAPAVEVAVNGLKTTTVILVDYDDGLDNGIHDASIRNGGLEDGPVGTTALNTPWWDLRQGVGSDADDGTPLVYGTDAATGSKRGRINGWQGPETAHAAGLQFPASDWTLEEGDTFTVELKWRGDTGYSLGNQLHFWLNGIDVYGNELSRFGSVGEASTNDNTSTYETYTYTTDPIPAGSPLIGQGFEVMFGLTAPGSAWYMIDDVCITANYQVQGAGPTHLEVTGLGFEPSSQEVTMRWYNTGSADGAYTIKSIGDLMFPGATNEFKLDGSQDYSVAPGEIQFQFIDPDATGGSKFYWIEMD